MAERQWLSDYALLMRRGARRLVIGVSAVGKPPRRFDYFKVLEGPDHDLLLLNSPENGWYFNGVPLGDGAPSLAATQRYLCELAAGYDEVVVIGGSMGAYGALILGQAIPGARILAMSPETYAGLAGGAFIRFSQAEGLPPGLSRLLADPALDYTVITGERNAADFFCTSEVPRNRLLTVRNGYHQVAAVVSAHMGGMQGVVDPLLEGRLAEVLKPILGELSRYPDLGAVLYLFEEKRLSAARVEAFIETLPKGFYGRAILHLRLGQRARAHGNPYLALDHAARARALNPSDIEAHLLHDQLYARLHGAPPPPGYQQHLDPRFAKVLRYHQQWCELARLHGDPPPEPLARPAAKDAARPAA
ncbi:hypothetical protein SAMN06297129_2328 [Pseudooceanicola antarcticus]|uniref:Uncharacterized protein n=1 Tax=Pseudooceanicola antarcticus TaxID=1247613 RepID=A0A285IWT3_9RHOB|nr:hypothetical protein [Pseudooceanicola antarcticus]PJE25875.1 hypothetical protein CVM39_19435 [Pseudooceanicola antarcticus]SNY52510.1 hypothetical protein SAMN06297129_2328 [Pseudooceanicola antarcticus]